ncbi:MAG: alpha-E domain-containing protein, partial [Vicinamibacterales bacterium]
MLLSRAADSLYWISRYLERAEHASRVIDVRL